MHLRALLISHFVLVFLVQLDDAVNGVSPRASLQTHSDSIEGGWLKCPGNRMRGGTIAQVLRVRKPAGRRIEKWGEIRAAHPSTEKG